MVVSLVFLLFKLILGKARFFSAIWCTKKSIQNTSSNPQVLSVPVSTTTNSQYLHERLKIANIAEKPPATISEKTHQARNHKGEHDLVHDRRRGKARVGARFGARQTEKSSYIILAPAQQQTWQTSRWSLMGSLDNVWFMFDTWYGCDSQSQMALRGDSHVLFLLIWCVQTTTCLHWAEWTGFVSQFLNHGPTLK